MHEGVCKKSPVSAFTHVTRVQHKVLLYPALDFAVAVSQSIFGVGAVDEGADTGSDGATHTGVGSPLRSGTRATAVEAGTGKYPVGKERAGSHRERRGLEKIF